MAATNRKNMILQQKAKEVLKNPNSEPIDELRAHCLARGATGIQSISRTFKIFDDDGDRKLDFKEFKKGLRDYGIVWDDGRAQQLFNSVDVDHGGTIDFDEFLRCLRPKMSNARMSLILQAFNKLDKTKDGKIMIDDLRGVYNVKNHPKYLSGEKTEEQLLKEFLVTFEDKDSVDGVVTQEEFINYYSGVSASIDLDSYFDLMMRNAWKL